MKNSTLMKLLECLHIRDYNPIVEETGFKMDFSLADYSQVSHNSIKTTSQKKNKISSFLLLVLFFLFTNFLFAQQPACNLNGILETMTTREGGQEFTISPELKNVVPGTIYKWEFVSNNSRAEFTSDNGQPSIKITPGSIKGEFNLRLTLINPAADRRASKTCSCTKSVSIGNF